MTQFGQNPNQPPIYYGYASADPYAQQGWSPTLKVCRAAAIAQLALGCLVLLLGCCSGFYGFVFSIDLSEIPSEQSVQIEEAKNLLGQEGIRALLFDGCGMVVGSILQVAIVWWVWRGRRWAIWTSLGATGVIILMAAGVTAYCAVQRLSVGLCFNGLLILLEAGLIVLLGFALREWASAATAATTYAAQWQQYYQQYQAAIYQQNLPPQPPAPPAPPAQPAPPQQPPPPPPPTAPQPPRPPEDQPGSNPPAPPAV